MQKKHFLTEENTDNTEQKFKSKNKIPKSVRILMRNKTKLSKAILKTNSLQKYLKMKDTLEVIETKIKESYSKRKMKQENIAISKMKKYQRAFFSFAKKCSKTGRHIS